MQFCLFAFDRTSSLKNVGIRKEGELLACADFAYIAKTSALGIVRV